MAAAGDAGAARDLLDEVIEALPAGVAVYDADERLKMFNTMAQQLSPPLKEPDAIGKTYEMLANEGAQRLVAAGMGPQPVDEWIERFRTKSTERQRQSENGRWYEWSEKATASGLTVGLRIDVTDIKRHELEIEEARARYQTLVDSLSDMVYAVDWRGHYTYVSPGAASVLATEPDKVIGTRFKDWIVPEDVERVIAGGRACHYSPSLEQRRTNFRMKAADGTIRPVELRFRKNNGNDPNAAQVGVIRDVTELEHARAEYQSLVDSLADVAYRLDVETGKLRWYHQPAPDEGLDLDEVFEKVLVDEGSQKLVLSAGKKGILWKVDRVTGKFLDYVPAVFQNVFTSIDRTTGRGTYRPDIVASKPGDSHPSCPSPAGGKNWPASSYDPQNDLIILPLDQICVTSGAMAGNYEAPASDGYIARMSAYRAKSFAPVWTFQQRAPFLTSAMTTAGGVGFVGDWDRTFRAFDLKTGKTLWTTRLGTTAQGFPTTYSVDGEQFIAVPTGYNGGSPEVRPVTLLAFERNRPYSGHAVYVFALPKAR